MGVGVWATAEGCGDEKETDQNGDATKTAIARMETAKMETA